jgi:aminomethyltransferase
MAETADLKRTPLHALHVSLGAKMVPFAGYDMPVQYPAGVLKEHLHTRSAAGLFDVSHMGQRFLVSDSHEKTVAALEALTPGDFKTLGLGRIRYSMLLTDAGGIIDDFMVTRSQSAADDGALGLIVNAGRKDIDDAHIEARLPKGVKLVKADDRALLALQGPMAAAVLARHCPQAAAMTFMTANVTDMKIAGFDCAVSRSGYTGEDGYEISVPAENATALAEILLAEPDVLPIGLGARDSLRLEAGLCLYGHDIDETTSPVEAALTWAIGKRRKMDKDFPGAARIMGELLDGAKRKRVGVQPLEKAPAREGTEILSADGEKIGVITSGGFGPTVNAPVAMGYVAAAHANDGTDVQLLVRGTPRPARIAPMPFAPHRYHRG